MDSAALTLDVLAVGLLERPPQLALVLQLLPQPFAVGRGRDRAQGGAGRLPAVQRRCQPHLESTGVVNHVSSRALWHHWQ